MNKPSPSVFRLTALWALCESGLGGWMHALHLPFTGFVVGAFAIVIISLIAFFTKGSFRQLAQATLLVIAIKASVSPQSPPPAYIAVAFQGLVGGLLFSLLPFRLACILLGILAMVESALQKLVIATLIFGNSLWGALNAFFAGIAKELHLPTGISFSLWLIGGYTFAYAAWGLILGLWMGKLPKQLAKDADDVLATVDPGMPADTAPERRSNPARRVTGIAATLLFVLVVFFFGAESLGKVLYVLLRTMAVLALLLFVVQPVFRWAVQRFAQRQERRGNLQELMVYLPRLQLYIVPAYRYAQREPRRIARLQSFIMALIILTLYQHDEPQ